MRLTKNAKDAILGVVLLFVLFYMAQHTASAVWASNYAIAGYTVMLFIIISLFKDYCAKNVPKTQGDEQA
jgi:hypothetical protein